LINRVSECWISIWDQCESSIRSLLIVRVCYHSKINLYWLTFSNANIWTIRYLYKSICTIYCAHHSICYAIMNQLTNWQCCLADYINWGGVCYYECKVTTHLIYSCIDDLIYSLRWNNQNLLGYTLSNYSCRYWIL
jgi:hypothetical protein